MTAQQRIKELKNLIIETTKLAGKPFIYDKDFKIIHQPVGHKPAKLEEGFMAVYTFLWNDTFLKVGQVGAKSNARYQSQHYLTFRNRLDASTLARSITDDSSMNYLGLNDDTVGEWIKNNCERFDVLIDAKYGKIVLNFIEGLLQYKLEPKYEG